MYGWIFELIVNEEIVHTLMADISGSEPCGISLRERVEIFRPLRNEFNIAKMSSRAVMSCYSPENYDAVYQESMENWGRLSTSVIKVLSEQSKDILIFGWLLAAQIYLDHTFSGAAFVAKALAWLVDERWANIKPSSNGDEIENTKQNLKLASLWLGSDPQSCILYNPLCLCPLVEDITYMKYLSMERDGDISKIQSLFSSMDNQQRILIKKRIDNLYTLKLALRHFVDSVGKRALEASLSSADLARPYELVEKFTNVQTSLAGYEPENNIFEKEAAISDDEGDTVFSGDKATGENVTCQGEQIVTNNCDKTMSVTGVEISRDQAFGELRKLAAFFKKTEPHSPVSYLIEKSIRWGYTPLPELYKEIMMVEGEKIDDLFKLIGVEK